MSVEGQMTSTHTFMHISGCNCTQGDKRAKPFRYDGMGVYPTAAEVGASGLSLMDGPDVSSLDCSNLLSAFR